MVEDFGTQAIQYNDKMIVLSTQLDDWQQTSAEMTIALTEYFIENYNIDTSRVYLQGYSGGGQTGSLVMEQRPDLYAAFLIVSSQWDGDLNVLAQSQTPVYLTTGIEDSYYGSQSFIDTYDELYEIYRQQGLSEEKIDQILVLDIKDASFFTDRNVDDQHAGGSLIAHETEIMEWLFNQKK